MQIILIKHAEDLSQLLFCFSFALLFHTAHHHHQELIEVHCPASYKAQRPLNNEIPIHTINNT